MRSLYATLHEAVHSALRLMGRVSSMLGLELSVQGTPELQGFALGSRSYRADVWDHTTGLGVFNDRREQEGPVKTLSRALGRPLKALACRSAEEWLAPKRDKSRQVDCDRHFLQHAERVHNLADSDSPTPDVVSGGRAAAQCADRFR